MQCVFWSDFEQSLCFSAPETHECRVCNVSVKYLKEHLKNAHKITEQEYESLFENDDNLNGFDLNPTKPANNAMPKPPPLTPKPQLKIPPTQPTPEVMLPLVQAHDPSLPKPPKTDIQDKTNKTCSSCTITFDSRRSFIGNARLFSIFRESDTHFVFLPYRTLYNRA